MSQPCHRPNAALIIYNTGIIWRGMTYWCAVHFGIFVQKFCPTPGPQIPKFSIVKCVFVLLKMPISCNHCSIEVVHYVEQETSSMSRIQMVKWFFWMGIGIYPFWFLPNFWRYSFHFGIGLSSEARDFKLGVQLGFVIIFYGELELYLLRLCEEFMHDKTRSSANAKRTAWPLQRY